MEKKYYNSPDAKFIKLRSRASMLAGTNEEVGNDKNPNPEWAAKSTSLSFDEDEE